MGNSKYVCVILAAGEGRRAGGYKPLMTLGEETVVDRVIRAASAVADDIRVVGGFEFSRLEKHLDARWPAVTAVRNARWARGMFSSAQTGLDGVETAAFVHPADVPGPSSGVYRSLAAAYEALPRHVLRPVHRGRRGHPVLLSPEAVRAVRSAGPESTLREALAPLPCGEVAVDDELVLVDFDTLDELASLRARLRRRA